MAQYTTVFEITTLGGTPLGLHIAWAGDLDYHDNVTRMAEVWRFSPWLPENFLLNKKEGDGLNGDYGQITGATHAERTQEAQAMWNIWLSKYTAVPGTEALEWFGGINQEGQLREIPGFNILGGEMG